MKRSNAIVGIIMILLGVCCIAAAFVVSSSLTNLMFSFAGGAIGSGAVLLGKYVYWSSAKNRDRYAAVLEQELIDLQDERKIKLRDKSGRYAYLLGLGVVALSMPVFAVLGALKISLTANAVVFYLFGYLALQIVMGTVFYRRLSKKQ